MKLIGLYDSPYVRRTAVSLHLLGLPFEHEPLSVFSAYETFAAINPTVKAPTLVTDDSVVLLDSTLILEYAERLVAAERSLTPEDPKLFARAQRIVGLALAACEKTVQIVYELNLRPEGKRHQPWLERIQIQLAAAYEQLETEVQNGSPWLFGDRPLQADVSAAISYRFTREMLPERLDPALHPNLAALSAYGEQTEAFLACPFN
ncbi:glutathione S-transferase [uncultured Roseibium sp.]|uniref:glutathione S-transferase family protein n=1 Tax=uncultured Roseibium sp. TaxID=1936171 RepID=UPI0032171D96